MPSTCMLMSADRPLLEFVPESAEIVCVFEESLHLLPPLLGPAPDSAKLAGWLGTRISPLGERLLSAVQKQPDGPLGALEKTMGLSLNDVWWISDGRHAWKDVNLYENSLDPDVARAAFADGRMPRLGSVTRSPEWTTGGEMAKCWFRRDGKIFLAKRDAPDADGVCQTTREWFAQQVAEAMGLDCVKYRLRPSRRDPLSPVCECVSFTDMQTGFMPASFFLASRGAWNGIPRALRTRPAHGRIAAAMGVEWYEDMMLFDALVGNSDRHLGNFGMLFDNSTGRILRPAPLFDHGFAFSAEEECQFFSRGEQMAMFVRPRHEEALESMLKLELEGHAMVSDRAAAAMQEYVRKGAESALELLNGHGCGLRPE